MGRQARKAIERVTIGAEGRQGTVPKLEMIEAVPHQKEEVNTVAPNTATVIMKVKAVAAPKDPAAATTAEVSHLKKVTELTKPISQGSAVVVATNLYKVIIVVLA